MKWIYSLAADYVLVTLSWLVMGALLVPLRHLYPRIRSFAYDAGAPVSLVGIALLHAALITLMEYTERLQWDDLSLRSQVGILAKSTTWATAMLCFAFGLQGASWVVGGIFCASGSLAFGVLCAWRWWSQGRNHVTQGRMNVRKVVIVGASQVGRRIAFYLAGHPGNGRQVCGFLDDEQPLGDGVIGRVADLSRMARKEFVDEVILAAPRSSEMTRWVLDTARRLRLDVEIVPDLFGCEPVAGTVESLAGAPVICLHAEKLPAGGLVLKRIVDLLGAGGILVFLSPLMAMIAVLIKLDSPGRIFYCAARAGRKGARFRCYKFRTMVSTADDVKRQLREKNERSGPFFKMADDPRITRLGRYLRRYSLDELPQLWNVIKGEMSLVGPRPHPLDDVAGYEIEHLARLDVTPGLTGLWQVTARRDPSFDRAMELDREYIRSWSLALDLRILFRTLRAVMCGSGN